MLNGNGFNAQTYLESFGSNFNLALGANNDIDLRMLCQSHGQQKGSAYWIKSYKPKGAYDETTGTWREQLPLDRDLKGDQSARAGKGTISRREWEVGGSTLQKFENDLARRTPHQDIDFYQTLVEPLVIETGHEFETLDELLENNDPTSPTISLLVSAFKRKRNMQVISAITASSMTRKRYNASTGVISNVQEAWSTNAPNNAYETAQAGYFSLKTDAPKVRAILDSANVPDKTKVPVLINPHDFADTCINSFDKWADIPYVTKQDIENGTMPDSFGLSFIKCNEIPKGKMYAWLPQAIAYVPWRSLSQKMGEDATYRFHPKFYAEEAQGFARVDDWGVVDITIKSA